MLRLPEKFFPAQLYSLSESLHNQFLFVFLIPVKIELMYSSSQARPVGIFKAHIRGTDRIPYYK